MVTWLFANHPSSTRSSWNGNKLVTSDIPPRTPQALFSLWTAIDTTGPPTASQVARVALHQHMHRIIPSSHHFSGETPESIRPSVQNRPCAGGGPVVVPSQSDSQVSTKEHEHESRAWMPPHDTFGPRHKPGRAGRYTSVAKEFGCSSGQVAQNLWGNPSMARTRCFAINLLARY